MYSYVWKEQFFLAYTYVYWHLLEHLLKPFITLFSTICAGNAWHSFLLAFIKFALKFLRHAIDFCPIFGCPINLKPETMHYDIIQR